MNAIHDYLQTALPGATLGQISVSAGIILATILLRNWAVNWAVRGVERAMVNAGGRWDDNLAAGIRAPISAIALIYGFILALQVLPLPEKPVNVSRFVDFADRLAILALGIWLLLRLITVLEALIRQRAADPGFWLDLSLAPFIAMFLRVLVLATGAVMIAQNLGYSVSALVASLGLGAAALALASKDTLANFFGSLMIMMDKPFKVGDLIKGPDFEGTVEEIGLRSTRIRTPEKTVLNVPNSLIVNMIVENVDRRRDKDIDARRVETKLAISMDAKAGDLERAVEGIKNLLNEEPAVEKRFEPSVHFTNFAEFSYEITAAYFVSAHGEEWLKARERVNLRIMRKLEELGLRLALPARYVLLAQEKGKKEGGF